MARSFEFYCNLYQVIFKLTTQLKCGFHPSKRGDGSLPFLLLLCPRLVSLHMLNHHKHPLLFCSQREKTKEEYQRGLKKLSWQDSFSLYAMQKKF
jgi:hypothetical protein